MHKALPTLAPEAVVMIRPLHFKVNPETAKDNLFQVNTPAKNKELDLKEVSSLNQALGLTETSVAIDGPLAEKRGNTAIPQDPTTIAHNAYREISIAADVLVKAGVDVHLFDDTQTDRPDSVFPNNWFSTHPGGHLAIYPMTSENRRLERRYDIIEYLKSHYRIQDIVDYSGLEQDALFLEGTGAMVFDHLERVAYVARSKRADPIVLERFCTQFHYEPMVFDAVDCNNIPIYHTNVMMAVTNPFALVGLSMITNTTRRKEVQQRLSQNGREIIDLTPYQINNFAANALELSGSKGAILAISKRGLAALEPAQIKAIESQLTIVPLAIPTIEMAGGSVRCTLAGIHLSARH